MTKQKLDTMAFLCKMYNTSSDTHVLNKKQCNIHYSCYRPIMPGRGSGFEVPFKL
jgi:hypothetical protein